jgi:hypothetical protein
LYASVAAFVLLVNLLAMPRVMLSGDPAAWREEARSLIRAGELSVDQRHARFFEDPGEYFVQNESNGRWYSKYGIMNSIMALPPTAAESMLAGRVPDTGAPSNVLVFDLYNVLLSLAVAMVLLAITGDVTRDPRLRAAFVLACLFATYLWFYQRAQSSEIYQVLFFGSPFLTGYHQWHAEDHRPTAASLADGLYGFLFSVRWGVFMYFPVLLLALAGIRSFARKHSAELAIAAGSFAVLLIAVASVPSWRGEWTYGPRYLIATLPILSLPALPALEHLATLRPRLKAAAVFAIATVLLSSTYMQFVVNGLDFFAVHRIAFPFEKMHTNLGVFRYLNDHVEARILRDLQRHDGRLSESALFEAASKTLPPAALQQYDGYVSGILHETNWFWWPPRQIRGG